MQMAFCTPPPGYATAPILDRLVSGHQKNQRISPFFLLFHQVCQELITVKNSQVKISQVKIICLDIFFL